MVGISAVPAELGAIEAPNGQWRSDGKARLSDRRIAAFLFIGVLAVYLAVMRAQIDVYDTQAMLAVTHNLVNQGSLQTIGAGFVDSFHQATPYSPYGIAMSLLGVPFVVAAKATGHEAVILSMVNPLITACTVVVIFRIVRVLSWSALLGVFAALGYGLFTMALWYTTEGFSEPGVALCVAVIVLGVLRWSQGSRWAPLWIGLAAALAIQFRSDSMLTVWIGLVALPLLVPVAALRSLRSGSLMVVPMAISLAGLVAYNELRFHKVFVSSYGVNQGLDNPLGLGLHGLLWSPGKSLFVFNPLTVLGVIGLGVLVVIRWRIAVLFLLLVVPRVLFFAKWSVWDGGWCWGPRFLLPVLPVLLVAAVVLLRVTSRTTPEGMVVRVAAGVLLATSAAVNILSISINAQQWLGVLATPVSRHALGVPGLEDGTTQNFAYDFTVRNGPLWGDIRLLEHHVAQVSPHWWVGGVSVFGVVLLLVAILCLGPALAGSRRSFLHSGGARAARVGGGTGGTGIQD